MFTCSFPNLPITTHEILLYHPPISEWDFLHLRHLELEEENYTIRQEMQSITSVEQKKRAFEASHDKMHLIAGGIYLGDIDAYKQWISNASPRSTEPSVIISAVNVNEDGIPQEHVQHMRLNIEDSEIGWSGPNGIKGQLRNIFQLINQARLERKPLLIHCTLGRSRSASILIAYLMWACRRDFQSVLQFVQNRRWQASPSPDLRKILQEEYQTLLEKEGVIQ